MEIQYLQRQGEPVMEKTIGFTCSAFDLFHAGHVYMLEQAKQKCDYLIVGLQTDPSLDGRKKRPIQSVYERYVQLTGCKYIDKIIPYDTEADLLNLLVTTKIDIRFLGSDYVGNSFTGNYLPINVVYLERQHSWSSSEIKSRIAG